MQISINNFEVSFANSATFLIFSFQDIGSLYYKSSGRACQEIQKLKNDDDDWWLETYVEATNNTNY